MLILSQYYRKMFRLPENRRIIGNKCRLPNTSQAYFVLCGQLMETPQGKQIRETF